MGPPNSEQEKSIQTEEGNFSSRGKIYFQDGSTNGEQISQESERQGYTPFPTGWSELINEN